MGTRYDTEDWVVFLSGGGDSDHLRDLQKKFEDRFEAVAEKRFRNSSLGDYWEYADDAQHDAYLAFASIVGHGVGLWEGDEPHHEMLEGAVLKDKKLGEIAQELDWEMSGLDPDN